MDARFPAGWTLLIAVACTAHLLLGFGISMLLNWYTASAPPTSPNRPTVEPDAAVNGELALVGRGLLELIHHQPSLAPKHVRSMTDLLELVRSLQEKLGGAHESPQFPANACSTGAEKGSTPITSQPKVNPDKKIAAATLPIIQHQEPASAKRFPYEMVQCVGPCPEDGLPEAADFQAIQCHDISNEGISFFLDEPPDYEQFVITLGSMPNPKYMLGEVLHHRCVYKLGRTWYLVECSFIKRLSSDAFDPAKIAKAFRATTPEKIRA